MVKALDWWVSSNAAALGNVSTASLPSLPDPLWAGMVALVRVLSMGLIELNSVLKLNWIAWNRTVLTSKLLTYAGLNCL